MRLHLLITAALVLILSSTTFAQEKAFEERPLLEKASSEKASHVALWVGIAADFASTRAVIKHGGHETGFMGDSAKPQAVAVLAHGALTEILSSLAARSGHPTMAKRFRWITAGFYIGSAGRNSYVFRTLRR